VANISRITDSVFTGGDLPLHIGRNAMIEHLRDIEDAGITHIIDNRIEWTDEAFVLEHSPKISYLHNPQDDAGQRMPDSWFDRGVGLRSAGLRTHTASQGAGSLPHGHQPRALHGVRHLAGAGPRPGRGTRRDPWRARHRRDRLRRGRARLVAPESKASPDVVARQRSEVAAWFEAHPIDTVYTIRTVREEEGLIW
jgi:hypothetical protein